MKERKLKASLTSMKWPSARWTSMNRNTHILVWAGITSTRLCCKDSKGI